MKFRTAYDRDRVPSPCGSRLRDLYIRKSDGSLVKNGVEDVFDSIQKAAQGITLADLIARASRGDTDAIGDPVDSFVDFSHVPSDLLEAHQMLVDAKDKFNSLPSELRSKFGGDFSKFLAASADGSAISELQQLAADPQTPDPLSGEELNKIRSMIGGTSNA